jgi:lipopolysaccharide transport system ATP-binding protein
MKPIIKINGLGKRYQIGVKARYRTLRESVVDSFTGAVTTLRHVASRNGRVAAGPSTNNIWALKDVDLEIFPGEVVGVIGRNGAGKSTLLKILSRITEPTTGRVDLYGRVGSLLEVGTGFHPELTGRENIFLNGAILGMKRGEMAAKFDEIVDFSGVEKFLDTPVKHYSSGMHVRLAFAVAAHLEPEILLIDEVLAVGDSQFQKKCLGKMREVSQGGRTVLFVSHNIEAVLRLCTRGILIASGQIAHSGAVSKVAARYLEEHLLSPFRIVNLKERSRSTDPLGCARFASVSPIQSKQGWAFVFGQNLAFEIRIEAQQNFGNIELGVAVSSARGFEVASWTNTCSGIKLPLTPGTNIIRVHYEDFDILPGQYYLGLGLRSDRGFEDYISEAARFEIWASEKSAAVYGDSFAGVIVPRVKAYIC